MRFGVSLVSTAISIFSFGCPAGDDAADTGAATDGSTGTSTMTGMPTTTTPTTSTSASTTTAEPTTDEPTTTDVTSDATEDTGPSDTTDAPGTETTPADTGSTGEPSDPCAAAPDDTDCDMCVKGMCCAQLTACDADPECVCFQDCAGSMEPSLDTPMICGQQCMIDTPFAHPTVGQVLSCSAGCIASCI